MRARYAAAVCVLLGSLLVPVLAPLRVWAVTDPALTGGSPITSYSGTAAPITDVQVTGTGNPTVPVRLRVTSGSLSMTTTTGLTFTGGSSGATLQFSGTLANVNTALATLRYTRTGTGSDTLEASLVNAGEVFFADSGHLYEYVSYTSNWANAKTNAEGRTKYGATGYLTTITSQAENDFVAARLLNAGWMGASDASVENDWKWVTGPENNTSFWSGLSGGSVVGGRYANWGSGEPNNAGDEDCGQFLTGGTGKWNDLPCTATTLPGYVVEYGTSTPLDVSALNVAITTLAANQYPTAPTSLGPVGYVGGGWGNTAAPALTFTLADPDGANTVRYRVQIDNTADFSSPLVDYTSALAAQGARTFTVGQAAGSGSYAVGSNGQTLGDGSYYWRVKAIDSVAAEGSYAVAHSGSIAFQIDTGLPQTPPTPTTTTPTVDTTPTWSLGSITDSGSGSGTLALEWSLDSAFGSGVTSSQVNWPAASSFTHSTPLADGSWYFRTKATDAGGNVSGYSAVASVVLDTTNPTTPGTPSAGVSATANSLPTLSWTASSDSGAGLHGSAPYTVQWSQDATFGTYSSATATAASFTIPSGDQLTDGTWYFRVRSHDALSHTSAYSSSGSLTVDTVGPTTPGTPVVSTPKTDSTPALSWAGSSDSGVGLAVLAYTVEWSRTADFSGVLYGYATGAGALTIPSALGDGTWYFRIRAADALGNESAYSAVASISIDTSPPPARVATVSTVETVAEPTPPAPPASPAIVLNTFDEYVDGSGKDLTLSVGQVVYFILDGEQHSATIKEVGSDYIIVTIASTPTDVRIAKGQALSYDVNHDGVDDINIALHTMNVQTNASLTFKQLAPVSPAIKQVAQTTTTRFVWWPYVVAAITLLVLVLAYAKKYQQANTAP